MGNIGDIGTSLVGDLVSGNSDATSKDIELLPADTDIDSVTDIGIRDGVMHRGYRDVPVRSDLRFLPHCGYKRLVR